MPADAAGLAVLLSVVAVDPAGWYPFVVAKFAAVSLAVVVCWWAAVREPSNSLDGRALRVFVGLLVVLSIAAVVGREPFYAWTGTPERHLGVATWVLFCAALVAGSRLADPGRLARFARWTVGAGIALGLYALIERWHPLIETTSNTDRLGGPYGSASFLGAALCLVLPVGVAAIVSDESIVWRWLAALSAALGTAALIGTGTRAAWLAIGLGGVVVLATRPPSRQTFGRLALPVAAVVTGAAFALVSGRTGSVTERTGGAGSRLDEWAVGLRIVADHPWLGVGPEGYRTALADGVTASYERTYGRSVLPDRAHNVFIDVAAAGGVVAVGLYVVLVVLVVGAAWRALRVGTARQAGLAAAAVVYLVQQFFLFPVATIDPVFWLIAGALLSTSAPGRATERASQRWPAAVAIPLLLVLFGVGVVSLAADRAAGDAVESGNLAAAERAVTLRPDVVRYRLLEAELAPRTIAGHDRAVAAIERALDFSPHDPIVELALGDALTRRAISTGDVGDRADAQNAWRELVDADRNCYRCHLGLGYAAALSGDVALALDAFEIAAGLEPPGTTDAADALAGLSEVSDRPGTDRDG